MSFVGGYETGQEFTKAEETDQDPGGQQGPLVPLPWNNLLD